MVDPSLDAGERNRLDQSEWGVPALLNPGGSAKDCAEGEQNGP